MSHKQTAAQGCWLALSCHCLCNHRPTSGVVVLARKKSLLSPLQEVWSNPEVVHKSYLAVVEGFPEFDERCVSPTFHSHTIQVMPPSQTHSLTNSKATWVLMDVSYLSGGETSTNSCEGAGQRAASRRVHCRVCPAHGADAPSKGASCISRSPHCWRHQIRRRAFCDSSAAGLLSQPAVP